MLDPITIGIISGITSSVVWSGVKIFFFDRSGKEKKEEPKSGIDDGSIKFNWGSFYVDNKLEWGYSCAKCNTLFTKDSKSYKNMYSSLLVCECVEYPNLHFHWSCPTCKFKAIMRTADSK